MKLLLIVFLFFFSSGVNSQGYLGKRLFVEYNAGLTPTLHKKMKDKELKSVGFFMDHTASLIFVKSSLFSFGISTTFSRPFAATGGFYLVGLPSIYFFKEDEKLTAFRNLFIFEWSRKGNHAPAGFYTRISFGMQNIHFQKESQFLNIGDKNYSLDFISEVKIGKRWHLFNNVLLDIGCSIGFGAPLNFYGAGGRFKNGFFNRAEPNQNYYINFSNYYSSNFNSDFHYEEGAIIMKIFKRDVMKMARRQMLAHNLFKVRVGISLGVL